MIEEKLREFDEKFVNKKADVIDVRPSVIKSFITSFYKQILEEVEKEIPNEQSHWLDHGDGSGHPHETEYDFGWNSAIKKVKALIDSKKQLLSITNIK